MIRIFFGVIALLPFCAIGQDSVTIEYKGKYPMNFCRTEESKSFDYMVFGNRPARNSKYIDVPLFYEGTRNQFPLILFPDDVLTMESGSDGSIVLHSENKIRDNELQCTQKLFQLYGAFVYQGFHDPDAIPFVNKARKSDYAQRDKDYYRSFKRHLPKVPDSNEERDSLIYDIYTKRVDFIDSFSRTNPVSELFRKTMSTYLLYRYLYLTIRGFQDVSKEALPDRLRSILNDPSTFNDSLVYMNNYLGFLWFYNQYLTSARLKREGTDIELLMNADTSLTGRSRDHVMYNIVYRTLTDKKKKPNDTLNNLFFAKCQTKEYIEHIKNMVSPKDIAANKQTDIIDEQKNHYDLKDILNNYKGKYVYIDFWASWCAPCVNEMPKSRSLSERYKGKQIQFLYISLDQDYDSWKNIAKNYSDFMLPSNSYLLYNSFSSSFALGYNIRTIPRYMLVGKNGEIIKADASRPSDPKTKQLLDKYLK